ncbi:hypothetical protein J6590_068395 [Homalodisca vitripennis]|nr:hypothetical protein J6590_068395 [Homalodisca vitripennis]
MRSQKERTATILNILSSQDAMPNRPILPYNHLQCEGEDCNHSEYPLIALVNKIQCPIDQYYHTITYNAVSEGEDCNHSEYPLIALVNKIQCPIDQYYHTITYNAVSEGEDCNHSEYPLIARCNDQ